MMNRSRLLIPYYRVSTQKQKRSGLGLEGQQAAVNEYARRDHGRVLAAYTEVETGKAISTIHALPRI